MSVVWIGSVDGPISNDVVRADSAPLATGTVRPTVLSNRTHPITAILLSLNMHNDPRVVT